MTSSKNFRVGDKVWVIGLFNIDNGGEQMMAFRTILTNIRKHELTEDTYYFINGITDRHVYASSIFDRIDDAQTALKERTLKYCAHKAIGSMVEYERPIHISQAQWLHHSSFSAPLTKEELNAKIASLHKKQEQSMTSTKIKVGDTVRLSASLRSIGYDDRPGIVKTIDTEGLATIEWIKVWKGSALSSFWTGNARVENLELIPVETQEIKVGSIVRLSHSASINARRKFGWTIGKIASIENGQAAVHWGGNLLERHLHDLSFLEVVSELTPSNWTLPEQTNETSQNTEIKVGDTVRLSKYAPYPFTRAFGNCIGKICAIKDDKADIEWNEYPTNRYTYQLSHLELATKQITPSKDKPMQSTSNPVFKVGDRVKFTEHFKKEFKENVEVKQDIENYSNSVGTVQNIYGFMIDVLWDRLPNVIGPQHKRRYVSINLELEAENASIPDTSIRAFINIEVVAPDASIDAVKDDLKKRGAKINNMIALVNGRQLIEASITLLALDNYSKDLKKMTNGEGTMVIRQGTVARVQNTKPEQKVSHPFKPGMKVKLLTKPFGHQEIEIGIVHHLEGLDRLALNLVDDKGEQLTGYWQYEMKDVEMLPEEKKETLSQNKVKVGDYVRVVGGQLQKEFEGRIGKAIMFDANKENHWPCWGISFTHGTNDPTEYFPEIELEVVSKPEVQPTKNIQVGSYVRLVKNVGGDDSKLFSGKTGRVVVVDRSGGSLGVSFDGGNIPQNYYWENELELALEYKKDEIKPVPQPHQHIRSYYLRDHINTIQVHKDGRITKTKGNPRALIVSRVDQKSQTVHFGVSICHPNDCFVRTRAREMALGRLQKRPFIVPLPQNPTGHTINSTIMNAILSDDMCKEFAERLTREKGMEPGHWEARTYEKWVEETLMAPRLRRMAQEWLSRPRQPRPAMEGTAVIDSMQNSPLQQVMEAIETLSNAGLDKEYTIGGLMEKMEKAKKAG